MMFKIKDNKKRKRRPNGMPSFTFADNFNIKNDYFEMTLYVKELLKTRKNKKLDNSNISYWLARVPCLFCRNMLFQGKKMDLIRCAQFLYVLRLPIKFPVIIYIYI